MGAPLFLTSFVGAVPMCRPNDVKKRVGLYALMWLCCSHYTKAHLSLIGACAGLSSVGRSINTTYRCYPLRIKKRRPITGSPFPSILLELSFNSLIQNDLSSSPYAMLLQNRIQISLQNQNIRKLQLMHVILS